MRPSGFFRKLDEIGGCRMMENNEKRLEIGMNWDVEMCGNVNQRLISIFVQSGFWSRKMSRHPELAGDNDLPEI